MKFYAEEPGHYPCEIILRGTDDVRVFRIESTVNPEGSTAEINFTSPVHQNVTQEIPLVRLFVEFLMDFAVLSSLFLF